MKKILVIGAGRSSIYLIQYLLKQAVIHNWEVRVGDMDIELAQSKVAGFERGTAFRFDINDEQQRSHEIEKADLVVSMLPAFMHGQVAHDCVKLGRHLVTASYVSQEMKDLHQEAVMNNVILMNEIGLDPGIDHMSAMKVIHEISREGGVLTAFYSYCGGLVAPESNDNPWGYKFSWNPRNVILAGQGTAQFIDNGQYKYLPYNRLFSSATTIHVEGWGDFDAYANRDSLSYRNVYGIDNIPTMLRGTLRMKGFCKAWNIFVQLGLTDDSWKIKHADRLTYAQLTEAFLPAGSGSLKSRLAAFLHSDETDPAIEMFEWTGMLSDQRISLQEASPAQIIQQLLERKWLLRPEDKDLVVMQHQFEFELNGQKEKIISSLVAKGEDAQHTAMAKTVGLPAAIAVKLILTGQIQRKGVCVPVTQDIYEPVLKELESFGIEFKEKRLK